MMIPLLAVALGFGIVAVGYARLGVGEPEATYNLRALVALVLCIAFAFLSGSQG
jgi:hypothetical protein